MTAPALPGSAAALLATQVETNRKQAAAVARPRVQGQYRGTGYYPVTVGGYVVGAVQKVEQDDTFWTALDGDGRAVGGARATRADAVAAVGATDAAVEAYRAAAREGTFGVAEQRQMERDDAALQLALDADAAYEAELDAAPDAELEAEQARQGEWPPLTGQAAKDDRDEHDARRGVKWVAGCPLPGETCDPDVDHDHDPIPDAIITNQEVAVTAPAQPRTIPYVPGRTGWAAGTATPADKWLTVWGSAYDTELLFVDRADAQARADGLNASAPRDRVVVRHVRVVANPGVTLTGIAFRILPEPGAAYRAALVADAPTGDPCPSCHQLHDSATAEADCLTDT